MCYIGRYSEKQYGNVEQIFKICLSSDRSLQLENVKQESLVIADQHAAVNMSMSFVHTARQAMEVGFA
jgi:hypothetical protein